MASDILNAAGHRPVTLPGQRLNNTVTFESVDTITKHIKKQSQNVASDYGLRTSVLKSILPVGVISSQEGATSTAVHCGSLVLTNLTLRPSLKVTSRAQAK